MGVPVVYRKGNESVNAQFNFIDIATGKGYVKFYAGDASGAFILSPNQFYSQIGYSTAVQTNTLTREFDCLFDRPLIIQGDCVVNMPVRVGTAGAYVVSAAIVIAKYSGSTETSLASGEVYQYKNAWGTNDKRIFTSILNIPRTKFKKGDKLRFRFVSNSGSSSYYNDFMHDPMNRTTINGDNFGVESSMLTLEVPIVISL